MGARAPMGTDAVLLGPCSLGHGHPDSPEMAVVEAVQ